jgi:hypothetical protein
MEAGMADIHIQRKRGPGVWPWILGVAVLALVVWGVIEMTGSDRTAADQQEQVVPAAEQPATDPQFGDPATGTGTGQPGFGDPAADPPPPEPGGVPQGTTGTGTGTGTGIQP